MARASSPLSGYHPGVEGRIQHVVAAIVLRGVKLAAPTAFEDPGAVDELLAANPEGIPLAPYRRLLEESWRHDGGLALLKCGAPIRQLCHPLLFVILNSDHPRLVIEKEARLAVYFHSRHRVQILAETDNSLTLVHSGPEGEAPRPTESLASIGQHIPILEDIGCKGLRVRLPESSSPRRWIFEDGRFLAPGPSGSFSVWQIEWESFSPSRRPMPGLDEILMAQVVETRLVEAQGPIADIRRIVQRDLSRSWRIGEVAQALGTSTRSLQRSVRRVNESYREVLDTLRNEEAARLLRNSSLSLTEIGYVCGFADAAHFSRSFKRRFEQTPSSYRARTKEV